MVTCKFKKKRNIISLIMSCVMIFTLMIPTNIAKAEATYQESIMGYNASVGGGGWTTGNLGKTYDEGEWVPYQVVLDNVQGTYPSLNGMPDIKISYDFCNQGYRFVDLVRGIQVGTSVLNNNQGWPNSSGTAYDISSESKLNEAQNSVGEYTWNGFVHLDLPLTTQINTDLSGKLGTPTDAVRMITIKPDDLKKAGFEKANTIVIYFQLHESRTFVWENKLQSNYNTSPTNAWGGYVYGLAPFSADQRKGSGFVPGSSGHAQLEISGKKTVPIPIPPAPQGAVSGLKWLDSDKDGVKDTDEPTLSGWRIFITGIVEGVAFSNSTLTDANGNYSFPDLTVNTTWIISEAVNRQTPAESGYEETYPKAGSAVGVASAVSNSAAGQAAFAWAVALKAATPVQANVNFGNIQYGSLTVTKKVDVSNIVGTITPPSFFITIKGPSYPSGDKKEFSVGNYVQTWENLIPGPYTITEDALGPEWKVTVPNGSITVSPGATAFAEVTNAYVPGSLTVTKKVDVSNIIGAITPPSFFITIKGPSYPSGDKKEFSVGNYVQTWENLIPGPYTITEDALGPEWKVTVPNESITVSPGATAFAEVTNAYVPGSLTVTKIVDFAGVVGVTPPSFFITIKGPSYPSGDKKEFSVGNYVQTWENLIPGPYTITEDALGAEWIVTVPDGPVSVSPGTTAYAQVTNTYVPQYYSSTAWAYNSLYSKTFTSISRKLKNWGWTNGPLTQSINPYEFKLIASAGQNLGGIEVGKVTVLFNANKVTVTYNTNPNIKITDAHLYVGQTPLPIVNGKLTDSPGQFPDSTYTVSHPDDYTYKFTIDNITLDKIYVAAHGVVQIPY